MYVLKYYVDYKSYSNMILVNKNWYAYLKDMTGPLMFNKCMKREGWLDTIKKIKNKNDFEINFYKSLKLIEILNLMIETMENSKKIYLLKKDKEYYTNKNREMYNFGLINYRKIKNNTVLNSLNLITTTKY